MRRNTFVSGFIAEVASALCAQPPCGLTFADDATDWIAELPRYPVHVTDWPTDKGAVKDFAAFCKTTGNALIEQSEADGIFTFLIRKTGP